MSDIKICKAFCEYNEESDAIFIHDKKDYIYDSSIELENDIILDYDHEGNPVAIEILNPSKIFKIPKNSLNDIVNFIAHVKVTEKLIQLELTFDVYLNNEKQSFCFDSFISNDVSLPDIEIKIS